MKKIRINKSRFAIFILTLAIAGTGIFAYGQSIQKVQYERHLDSYIKKNYQDLVGYVETISGDLSKLMVSGSDKQNLMLLTKIWDQADAAGQCLAAIPVQNEQLRKTQKFINQLADFAYAMTQQSFQGSSLAALSDADLDLLRQLYEYSIELCEGLYNVDPQEVGIEAWKQAGKNKVRLADVQLEQEVQEVFARTEAAEPGERKTDDDQGNDQSNGQGNSQGNDQGINEGLNQAGDGLGSALDSAMSTFEGRLMDYPKMIYDGPFSDHMQEGGLAKITGDAVTEEEARKAAAMFIDPTGAYPAENLTLISQNLTYLFEYHMKKDATCYITVTKNGGKILTTMCSELAPISNISRKQAEKTATKYLAERGITDVALTYSQKTENTALMCYAAKQADVTMYPDLIKVFVSLYSGEIVGYEAENYLINHKKRNIPAPAITPEEALKNINQNGKPENIKLCYIPNEYGGENFCYEIKVKSGNDYFLFYINAKNGDLQDELRLIIDENGTLTA